MVYKKTPMTEYKNLFGKMAYIPRVKTRGKKMETKKLPMSFEELKKAIGNAEIENHNKAIDRLQNNKSFTYRLTTENLKLISLKKAIGYSVSLDKKTLRVTFRRDYINSQIRKYENISPKIWAEIIVYVEESNKSVAWSTVVSSFETEYKNTFLLE